LVEIVAVRVLKVALPSDPRCPNLYYLPLRIVVSAATVGLQDEQDMSETVEIRTKLCQRLERIANQEDLSLAELVDHALRVYAEDFAWDVEDEDEEEDL
jgi:hypothetical protein